MCFWTLKNHESIWSTEIFFQKALHDIDVYRYRHRIGIGRYEKNLIGNLSDRPIWKMGFIGAYRNRPIWKKAYRLYPAAAHCFDDGDYPKNDKNK